MDTWLRSSLVVDDQRCFGSSQELTQWMVLPSLPLDVGPHAGTFPVAILAGRRRPALLTPIHSTMQVASMLRSSLAADSRCFFPKSGSTM
ncbi:hypothetical protein ABTX61_08770 [Amycolatopsis japonica]|uniref:hypothetical protein n=1 Tax=Amycolatopsis japonica TaxID=208439 RepID=UPI003319B41E